ncbi:hypothetical protein CY35_06G010600 [Sphagnum magellanicum]|nr:hypothetical protein CY35_06G010600 [Sphagnum magellanicum]
MMLTTDGVYKSIALPPRVLENGLNSEIPKPGLGHSYTKLSNGSSEIEMDTIVEVEDLSVDGRPVLSSEDSGDWSSSSSVPELASISEPTRHPRRHKRRPLGGEHRRRRGSNRQSSFQEFRSDVQHAATETYLISRLTLTLLRYLGIGTRWIGMFIRLALYALFLMPGFIQVGFFYYFSKSVHRSIIYGDQPRNRLDLYLPPESDKPKPVVIFVTGGAWIIGYKAWGSLLGQQLLERNVIVVCIDYRNFPQGCVSDMISDITTGIGYVVQNIASYGGDTDRLYLAGQSAGAHLAACALIMQAEKEYFEDPTKIVWRASQLRAYLALSGGFNLLKLVEHFHQRGLYRSLFLSVMEGEASLPLFSPEIMVMNPSFRPAVPLLPPITLFHGMADFSIPYEASVTFGEALQLVGAKVSTILYPDKTHTDLFLQDPMRGGKDKLLGDILSIVFADDEEAKAEDAVTMMRRRLVPEILLQLGRKVSPF